MKISTNWLNDYVDIKNLNKIELADKITKAGVNVEQIQSFAIDNLVIGQVLEVQPHPSSDRLNICKVDVGDEILQIVCGASNVSENIKVIVAKVGAVLPEITIKEATIRGVTSKGMICALFELGLEDKETHYNDGIYILDDNAKVGDNPLEYLELDDTIYTLDLNPNRNDCLSHIGFAYEVSSVLGIPLKRSALTYQEISESIEDNLDLKVETPNCLMYKAKMVKDVKIGPSPLFIKNRLESVGIRSINNVVDISNYIMLELGQPLHFFDKDKLEDKLIIRMANDNEKITTLDNQERALTTDDIVIANDKSAVAIAGVMGGANTAVDDNTTNILIESAIFNPYNVRYTSIRQNLRSESAVRFEKGLNYEYTIDAIDMACHLLEKYAQAKVLKDELSYDNTDKTPKVAQVSKEKIEKVLGINLTYEDINKCFANLGFTYTLTDDLYEVIIPNRRMDVAISEDLIEEVGRLYGYDNIKAKLPVLEIRKGGYSKKAKFRKEISKKLRNLGLNETRTYTLISPEDASLFNTSKNIKLNLPMSSDRSLIRTSILPSLLKVYEYNHKRGVEDINIYEISNVYYTDDTSEELKLAILMSGSYITNKFQNQTIKVDFYILKALIEELLSYLGFNNRYEILPTNDIKDLHPNISANIFVDKINIGFMGKISPTIMSDDSYVLEISLEKLFNLKRSKIKYQEPSKYPGIRKDVAFILGKDILAIDVIKKIKKSGTKLLTDVDIFDVYEGDKIEEGKRQLAFSLIFNDSIKTLTDKEVNDMFNNVIDAVCKEFNCKIRDK